jgi:hypothetical protein
MVRETFSQLATVIDDSLGIVHGMVHCRMGGSLLTSIPQSMTEFYGVVSRK